ncbi:amidase [Bradyrhizobium sp. NP1]|uniref:amidase n=1 Tax=Bradyrhizobium sp. NP1 TaxID=3049772 RepID=UPI0025A4D049|nr:amidase [Bradyrhizobium sp. NP1]WJR79519.1 amidase [Bradyrhizobium sp. NP1]
MSDKIARRDFLGSVALAGAAAATGPNFLTTSARAAEGKPPPIILASASELATAIRTKQLTSKAVVEAHLDRIAQVNPKLNAIVQLTAEIARKEADEADAALARGEIKGPLHGVPMTIKDTLETSGVICTGGTKGRANYVPKADATAVARLRAAGAIFLGKTNVPELAGAIESDNLVYGRTNNPYDLARTPGGSSGGEAAIVAACGSPLGLGTDAGGSIRIPAHFCGLAAIKPTSGRVPRTGQFPLPLGARASVFHVSLIARRVEDLALALPIISGPDFRDNSIVGMPLLDPKTVTLNGLRVAWFDDDGAASPTREIAAAVRDSARAFADAGVKVEEKRPPDAEKAFTVYYDMSRGDGGVGTRAFLKSIGSDQISPLFEQALTYFVAPAMASTTEALAAFVRWDLYRNAMLRFLENYDAVLSPVAPYPAMAHGTSFEETYRKGLGYAAMYNLTGWPSATVRIGTSPEGLPLNVQVAARPWREDVALALTAHLEKSFGGWKMPTAV